MFFLQHVNMLFEILTLKRQLKSTLLKAFLHGWIPIRTYLDCRSNDQGEKVRELWQTLLWQTHSFCLPKYQWCKNWIKYNTAVQTEETLNTVGLVYDSVPHMEVAQMSFFGGLFGIRTGQKKIIFECRHIFPDKVLWWSGQTGEGFYFLFPMTLQSSYACRHENNKSNSVLTLFICFLTWFTVMMETEGHHV